MGNVRAVFDWSKKFGAFPPFLTVEAIEGRLRKGKSSPQLMVLLYTVSSA